MEFHSTSFNDTFKIDNQIRARITAFADKKQQFVEEVDSWLYFKGCISYYR